MPKSILKFIWLIIIAIAVVGFSYYYSKEINPKNQKISYENTAEDKTVINKNETAKVQIIDSDEDGLKDWEETLWKTDPLNRDSDGDKTPDGEEVKQGRDPAKFGPKDSLTQKISSVTNTTKSKEIGELDKFARNFFTEFMKWEQTGGITSSENIQALVQNFLNQNGEATINDAYSPSGFNTVLNSSENLKKYGNEVAEIYERYSQIYRQNPLVITEEEFDTHPKEISKRVLKISNIFRDSAKEISLVSVPESLIFAHSELVNGLNQSAEGFLMFSKFEENPLWIFNGLEIHKKGSERQEKYLGVIASYLYTTGVRFGLAEKGFFWNNYK